MTPRRQPKQSLQKAIVDHLRWRAQPGPWWCHIPNGGLRSKAEAGIFAGLGVRTGAPDLLIVAYGKPQFLEVKTPSGAAASRPNNMPATRRFPLSARAWPSCALCARLEAWQVIRLNVSTQYVNAFSELRHNVARRAARDRRHMQTRS